MILATLFRVFHWISFRWAHLWPRKWLYDASIKYLPGMVLKTTGITKGAPEAETLRWIRKHTTIPVPRVYASAEGYGRRYLLMERIKGVCLEYAWRSMDASQRETVIGQLCGYVAQLRALPTPHGKWVCALNGEALRDSRITSTGPVGPFKNEADFNDFLIDWAEPYMDPEWLPEIRAQMRDDHRTFFTHGDIAPRNIMVENGRVSALVDWEQAGWYPEHWELVKAMWNPMAIASLPWNAMIQDSFSEDDRHDWLIDKQLSDRLVGAF